MPKFLAAVNLTGSNTLANTGAQTTNIYSVAGTSIGIGVNAINGGATAAADNVAVGHFVMNSYNAGTGMSVGIGNWALGNASTSMSRSVAVGYEAFKTLNNSASVAVGCQAGKAASSASNLTLVGDSAGIAITTGNYNTVIGSSAGAAITTGNSNTCVGFSADHPTGTGIGCTTMGYNARGSNSYSTALGYGTTATGTGSVAIGCSSAGTGAIAAADNEFRFGTASHLYYFPGKVNANLVFSEGMNIAAGVSTGTKIGVTAAQKLGFWNAMPVVQNVGWSVSGYTADRTLNAGSTTLNELAAVVATLIDTFKTYGLLGA
jgi:hypothetical protein